MTSITKEQIEAVELKYLEHEAKYAQGMYNQMLQTVFFVGAMEAVTAVGMTPPPVWLMLLMAGRDIVGERRGK